MKQIAPYQGSVRSATGATSENLFLEDWDGEVDEDAHFD